MSLYSGDYFSDLGITNRRTKLIAKMNDGGITDRTFDLTILPSIFFNHVEDYNPRLGYCDFFGTTRKARLWLNSTDYLQVDLPFVGNTSEFNQFFIAVSFNLLIVKVDSVGEKVDNPLVIGKYVS